MKIQCDVCDKEEASVFCSSDEAALCDGCDRRVHHANKLAGKHLRFSLLHPSFKEAPRCDICQERRAFLFCQEDRAILCRECDLPIHKANEHTQKHNRFLLTGVKLSASSSSYPSSSSSDECNVAVESETKSTQTSIRNPISISSEFSYPSSFHKPMPSTYNVDDNHTSDAGSISTSSISEYLMETLPGWHVEDFLDPSSAAPNGFCKNYDNLSTCINQDQDFGSNMSYFSSEDSIWVHQGSLKSPHQVPLYLPQTGLVKEFQEANNAKVRQKGSDDGFTVPQISPPSLKRTRHIW